MKEEKIKIFLNEAMHFAPNFRKNFMSPAATSEFNISPHQLFCLMVICKNEPISMSELAVAIGVSNQQLTRIMDGLVENELVERFTDPANRRLVKARISEKGKLRLKAFQASRQMDMIKDFEVLSEEELDECILHIKALVKILSKLS